MQTNTHRRSQRGITLIELLLVVSIVAILGSIALANYRTYALRANRAEAKSALLNLQAAQEKYYLNEHEYSNLANLNFGATTERGLYTIQLNLEADGEGYTAVATAAGSQVADSECASFTIDQTGSRLPPLSTSKCWR
jgi:type IV pilus assembly protein PilE